MRGRGAAAFAVMAAASGGCKEQRPGQEAWDPQLSLLKDLEVKWRFLSVTTLPLAVGHLMEGDK